MKSEEFSGVYCRKDWRMQEATSVLTRSADSFNSNSSDERDVCLARKFWRLGVGAFISESR